MLKAACLKYKKSPPVFKPPPVSTVFKVSTGAEIVAKPLDKDGNGAILYGYCRNHY